MTAISRFELHEFERKLQNALRRVQLVLDVTKRPCSPDDVHHEYEDKYLLANRVTNVALASLFNGLIALGGLDFGQVARLIEWTRTHSVSLLFRLEQRCVSDGEHTYEEESSVKRVEEFSVGGDVQAAVTSKVVTTVTEYCWNFEATYSLTAVRGVGQEASDSISILNRSGGQRLKTLTNVNPHPNREATVSEVNVSWMFANFLEEEVRPCFEINRLSEKCRTPSRNTEVDAAHDFYCKFAAWTHKVQLHLRQLMGVASTVVQDDVAAPVLVPVLPVMVDTESSTAEATSQVKDEHARSQVQDEHTSATSARELLFARLSSLGDSADSSVLTVADFNKLLEEEARTLAQRRREVFATFTSDGTAATADEASLIMILSHCEDISDQWLAGMDFIEGMLRKQLSAAVGKELTLIDFATYIDFHNQKLFNAAYAPLPFCYEVRRSPEHSPEGTVGIEQVVSRSDACSMPAPIITLVSCGDSQHPMRFPISASTNVSFAGDKYLHGWLSHRFSAGVAPRLELVARARQFSSMLVLVGQLASAEVFDVKHAAIVRNKEELKIPLELSTIPSPKEFKDAIVSLSPEQQDFARAFRSMQLGSTLFGILVIQIKPQLERVLNLPKDSLTKEIKLTQDLMKLFIDYQIPSDLLSFESGSTAFGGEVVAAGGPERLEAVRRHVHAMQQMILQTKEEELEEARMKESFSPGGKPGKGMPPPPPAPSGYKGGGPPPPSSKGKGKGPPMSGSKGGSKGPPPPGKGPAASKGPAAAKGKGSPPTFRSALEGNVLSAALKVSERVGAAPKAVDVMKQTTGSHVRTGAEQHQMSQQKQPRSHLVIGLDPEDDTIQDDEHAVRDYTRVPEEMDRRFEVLDADGTLRPAIISPSDTWTVTEQKALLDGVRTRVLGGNEQKKERDAAFDLLDALTKSGALRLEHASLHVMVAATHCFDKTLTDTVIQQNINPIDKVELSTLIMASVVHQQPAAALIRASQQQRVKNTSPKLFLEE